MNNHHHRNIWCANAWVGAPWACGDHHHYNKENFEVDASDMYASQDLATEGYEVNCNNLNVTYKKCQDVKTKKCQSTATTSTGGSPAPYMNCRLHKGKCQLLVKGEGRECGADCETEPKPNQPPYDLDTPYYDGRVSVQFLAKELGYETTSESKGGATVCTDIPNIVGGTGNGDLPFQQCDSYYQRPNPKQIAINLCEYSSDLNTCVASKEAIEFIPDTGKLSCETPNS